MYIKNVTDNIIVMTSSVNDRTLGMAHLTDAGKYQLIARSHCFDTLEDAASFFGEDLEVREEQTIESDIEGYPIKHNQIYDREQFTTNTGTAAWSYTTKSGSKVKFAAGFWGLKFKNGFTSSISPKIDTLIENEYIGPFKTKFDLQFEIGRMNREIKGS